MENYYGIKEIDGQAVESETVVKKTKKKITFLGVLTVGSTVLTIIAFVLLGVRFYLTL